MELEEIVRERYAQVNGSHPMTATDDEYCRRLFVPLPDEPDYPRDNLLRLIAGEAIPVPSYVLSDGTLMVHPDYLDVIRQAGGPQSLRQWFVGQWPEEEQDTAEEEWQAYLSGQYVCLHSVTPETIQAKARLVEAIRTLTTAVDADPSGQAQERLASAVDELDALEPPFTAYDRLRFGGPLSREVWIDDVRAAYLSDADEYRTTRASTS